MLVLSGHSIVAPTVVQSLRVVGQAGGADPVDPAVARHEDVVGGRDVVDDREDTGLGVTVDAGAERGGRQQREGHQRRWRRSERPRP